MSLDRCAVVLASALALLAGGCDEEGSDRREETGGAAANGGFYADGAKVDRCPLGIGPGERDPTCTLAYEEVRIDSCPSGGPGGGDVGASGVSCAVARRLRLSAGAGGGMGYGNVIQEQVYRPWLANGRFTDPVPERPIGWTCLKRFDPSSREGIRHVCWNENGGIVLFTVS